MSVTADDFGVGNEKVAATLDEPVSETLMRDLRRIGTKLKSVVLLQSGADMRDWDLWGPFLLTMSLSLTLATAAPFGQKEMLFSSVFLVVALGSPIVAVNAQLLGARIEIYQAVCVLGYALFPLNLAAIAVLIWRALIVRTIVVALAFSWSIAAAYTFISEVEGVQPGKKFLVVYPVVLLYIFLAYAVLIQG